MNILLTGGTSGIGFQTLLELNKEGHKIFVIARDFSKISEFINEHGENVFHFSFDLSQTNNLEKLFQEFENIKFDAFIHCAGMEETLPLKLYSPDRIKRIFDLNVFSGIELLRVFSKKKYSNNGASVVFISSVMGVLGQPGKVGYCSSKAAITGIVKSSALELSKRKFRINSILPGVVSTPMTRKMFEEVGEKSREEIIRMHPLGVGEVEDVVPTILFLISKKSKWITGQNIIIDGGYSIQ